MKVTNIAPDCSRSANSPTDTCNDMDQQKCQDDDKIVDDELDPIHDIIDFLVQNKDICFKSQQIGETDLNKQEKRTIAFNLFQKGSTLFLEKFGRFLSLEHLPYFENLPSLRDNCEVKLVISQLKTILNDNSRKVVVKNRRYEALSKMIKDESYFTEVEMMQRNPLLYDQLVGQFLSENERKVRDNIDTDNITFLNVLIEGIDRERTKTTMKIQKEKEDCQLEENSSDDDTNNTNNSKEDVEEMRSNWGEFETAVKAKKKNIKKIIRKPKPVDDIPSITATERALLKEEFVQEMYRSFLAGEDAEFDYHSVDGNTDYDCTDVSGRDVEEKYFDSESPENVVEEEMDGITEDQGNNPELLEVEQPKSSSHADSEDELDVYMKHLHRHPTLCYLNQGTDKMSN